MRILRKVLADLWNARGRAVLVVIAMTTGLFAVASIAATNAVLSRELSRSFKAISPASATIRVEPAPDELLDSIAKVSGVAAVSGGRLLSGRAEVGDERKAILLFTVGDYAHIEVNRLRPLAGAWPPPAGGVLLERAAVRVAGKSTGDTLSVRIGRNAPVPLVIAGTLHDFSQAPAWQEGAIYGYVSRETMMQLAGPPGLTEFRIIVAEDAMNAVHIREVAGRVASAVERAGFRVRDIQVPPPGEHPHQGQMNALLGIQQTFGLVALLLSGTLIVVLLNAMLVQHRRQIGAMKAVGAQRGAIVRMYVLWILILAACAEVVALPAGFAAGRVYAVFIAEMLNFDIVNESVPAMLRVVLIVTGGVLPLLVALRPIYRAANMSTREALHDVAMVAPRPSSGSRFRALRTRTGRLMTLGVANALRVRGRFVLVTATLALGGGLFLSALNLGRGFHDTLAVNYAVMGFDILLGVGDESPDSMKAMLMGVPGIASVEANRRARVTLAGRAATGAGSAMTHGSDGFTLNGARGGPTPPSLTLTQGRWLGEDDAHIVVANHIWMASHPQVAVGDSLALRIAGDSSRWLLAGEVREVMGGPALYASTRSVEEATRGRSRGTQVRIVTTDHEVGAVKQVMSAIDRKLADQGIEVTGMQSLQNVRKSREDHVVMIINFLLAIATLSLIVGGLGLATMLSVAIFERSQELGVMRAVGATRSQLLVLIVVEGAWIAFVGWLGSIVIALPATYMLDVAFGRMMLGMPLMYVVSAAAIPSLAAVSGVIALIASGVPAWRASLLEPRELLVAV